MTKSKSKTSTSSKKPQSKAFLWTLTSIFVVVLIGGGIYSYWQLGQYQERDYNLTDSSTMSDMEEVKEDEEIKEEVAEEPVEDLPAYATVTGWPLFTNTKHQYAFQYPPKKEINSEDMDGVPETSYNISTWPGVDGANYIHSIFSVDVRDAQYYEGADVPKTKEAMSKGLKAYSDLVWSFNKDDNNPNTVGKVVGPLQKTTVAGQPAYQFTLTKSFTDESGGYLLDGEFTYTIAYFNETFYLIYYPTKSADSKTMLTTFHPTK